MRRGIRNTDLADYWIAEFWRFGLLALAGLVVGVLTEHVSLGLLIPLAGYAAWHTYNLYRLEVWLRFQKGAEPPAVSGVWEEIFHTIYQIKRSGRKQKRRLTTLLGRFREATTAMPDATVVLKKYGEIEWFNDAASRLLNLAPRDLTHRIDNLFRHPDFVDYLTHRNYTQPLVLRSPTDNQVTLLIHVVPYGDEQRLLIARDITHVQRLEKVRSDFIANVSHELRTPLTVVMGFLESMADSDDAALQPWHRSLHLMREQATRMQLIVEQLLLLSRLETDSNAQRREDVDVPTLLQAIEQEAIALSGDKQHDIRLHCDEQLHLHGSAQELRSAFSNLVFNAVQYTPPHGVIRMSWRAEDNGAQFIVTDTGIGIPTHHLPRLTERFYRVDAARSREVGGTGLGLAIVKHVLQRHDATLRIESVVDQGSTFICEFPPPLFIPKPSDN